MVQVSVTVIVMVRRMMGCMRPAYPGYGRYGTVFLCKNYAEFCLTPSPSPETEKHVSEEESVSAGFLSPDRHLSDQERREPLGAGVRLSSYLAWRLSLTGA